MAEGRLIPHHSEAIVLRTWPFHEADLLVSLFTRDHGKVKGVARHAMKSRKRFGGALETATHVRAAYLYALADTPVDFISLPFPPTAVKHFALKLATPWPHSLTTIPQLKLEAPGMATTTFEHDLDTLLNAFDNFSSLTNHTRDHPFFGAMNHADWMRWGYLHPDHHLRQFNR